MASYYDSAKKCRVGTMDHEQFSKETSPPNARFFASLMAEWAAAGGRLKWGSGGVGLRAVLGEKEFGLCFLAPAYAGKKDRIELSLATLSKQIGPRRCGRLKDALQEAAGERFKGASMISIVEPGSLSRAAKKALTASLLEIHSIKTN